MPLGSTPRLHVGICGFGIAGGALATLLARDGHKVTLLERAPVVGPVGAGFLLQPSGQRVLESLGLLQPIIERSARIERVEAFTHTGRRLTDLRYSRALPGGCAYGVQRGAIFELLHSAVLGAGVRVVLDAEASTVDVGPTGGTVIDVTGGIHGPFDLIVGADGSRSRLREWLNPRTRSRVYEHGALWGMGKSSLPVDGLLQFTRGTRQLLGLLPIGSGRCGFFWGLPASELESFRKRGFAAFREDVLAISPMAEEILDDLGDFDRLTYAGYQHTLPSRSCSDRVVLVGDAAHSMSPHLGQGANLGLLDAECLARHLSNQSPAAALIAYAMERRRHSRYLAILSRVLTPFFQSGSHTLAIGRDVALPLMCAIPWIRRQMELTVAGVKRGFFDQL